MIYMKYSKSLIGLFNKLISTQQSSFNRNIIYYFMIYKNVVYYKSHSELSLKVAFEQKC
jgi:hypothetical protein